MPTAADLLAVARAELGYVESPAGSNRTKFAAEAGHANAQPWCATFIVAMARRVGLRLASESAYTPTMAGAFRAACAWHTSPRPGDLAFFDFPDSKRRIQHVGIVESATASTVTCIEGNTSPGNAGSQDNGGGVYRRHRSRAHVVGYGRPAYAPEMSPDASPETPPQTPPVEDEMFHMWNRDINGQYVTDWVTKWHIPDGEVLAEIKARLASKEVPLNVLEAIPFHDGRRGQ